MGSVDVEDKSYLEIRKHRDISYLVDTRKEVKELNRDTALGNIQAKQKKQGNQM